MLDYLQQYRICFVLMMRKKEKTHINLFFFSFFSNQYIILEIIF